MVRFWFVAYCPRWLRQRHPPRDSLGDVHVDRARWPNLVRLLLGNSAARNRVSIDLSLSAHARPPISEMSAAVTCHLAVSLARFSHHDRCRSHQTAGRSMLA